MKIFLLLFAFFLTTYAYTQTNREEVVERFEDGSKKKVITYSGVGNAEKILKITEYYSDNVSPYTILTYGNYVIDGIAYWGLVKRQYFKAGGAGQDETILYP